MDKDSPTDPSKPSRHRPRAKARQVGLATLWQELKRRHVVRVGIVYAVVAWIIIQIASATFEGFGIPDWAFRFVVLMVLLGFPVAVILAWAFELTPAGIKTTKIAQKETEVTEDSKTLTKKRSWFSVVFAATVPTLIFGTLALFFYFRSDTSPSHVTPEQSGGGSPGLSLSNGLQVEDLDKSIAVLPLKNMSPDPENAFFADGVQEDILTNLSRIDELRVISRTSTLIYKDSDKQTNEIGEELGVRYLVEGSVRRAGNKVLITVQLIDAQKDEHLWAENYNRSLDDIFAIQAEVARKIAGQLHAALSPQEIEKIEYRPTKSQEAYDNWLKHRQLLESPDLGNWDAKIDYLEKAVSFDPEFYEAWAHLSIEYIVKWVWAGNRSDPGLLATAQHALEEAKRLGGDAAYVFYARSCVEGYSHSNGIDTNLLLQALTIDPGFYRAHRALGGEFLDRGRLAEAQHHTEAFLRTEPFSKRSNNLLLDIYISRRMWDEAKRLVEDNLKRTENNAFWQTRSDELEFLQNGDKDTFIAKIRSNPGYVEDRFPEVRKALLVRDYPAALKRIERADTGIDDPYLYFVNNPGKWFSIRPLNLVSALIYFERGNREEWLKKAEQSKRILEEILGNNPFPSPTDLSCMTICHALLRDRQKVESMIEAVHQNVQDSKFKYISQLASEFHIAIAYLVLGDHGKAIEILEAADKLDSPIFLNRELELWFIFDRLRGNEKFDELLKDEG
jgi:TolB-like protein